MRSLGAKGCELVADTQTMVCNACFELLDFIRAEPNKRDKEIAKMIGSRSWRITRPLRQLGDVIRKFRNILGDCGRPKCK